MGFGAFVVPKFLGSRVFRGFCSCFCQLVMFYVGFDDFLVRSSQNAPNFGFRSFLETFPGSSQEILPNWFPEASWKHILGKAKKIQNRSPEASWKHFFDRAQASLKMAPQSVPK